MHACRKDKKNEKEAGSAASSSMLNLLQQFEYELLLLVGLGQRGDAGLFQDGVFGEAGDGRRDVGSGDGVLRRREVLHLTVDDVAGCSQPVDARTQRATNAGYVRDGRIDQSQCCLRVPLRVQVRGSQVDGAPAGTVGNGRCRQAANVDCNLTRSDGSRVTQENVGGGGSGCGRVRVSSQDSLSVGGTYSEVAVIVRVGDNKVAPRVEVGIQAGRIRAGSINGVDQASNGRRAACGKGKDLAPDGEAGDGTVG